MANDDPFSALVVTTTSLDDRGAISGGNACTIPLRSAELRPLSWPDFEAEILARYKADDAAKSTIMGIRQVLRGFARVAGTQTSLDLNVRTVALFARSCPDLAPMTVKGYLSRLRAVAAIAKRLKRIPINPWSEETFAPPRRQGLLKRIKRNTEPFHTLETIGLVLDHLEPLRADWREHRTLALIAMVAYLGLRKNEAVYLRVDDCELRTSKLIVAETAERRLKRTSAARELPIPDDLAPILAEWIPRTGSEWLFPGTKRFGPWTGGTPHRPSDVVAAAGKRAGVDGFTLLSLRHSWTTNALFEWDFSKDYVQYILGHTTPITQENYKRLKSVFELAKRRISPGIQFPRKLPMHSVVAVGT